jgi:hypothetical protein
MLLIHVAIDLTVAGDAGFPRTRLTALLDGGRQPSGGGIAAGHHDIVVTRHRRRHATSVSSDFFCVPFGGALTGASANRTYNAAKSHRSRRPTSAPSFSPRLTEPPAPACRSRHRRKAIPPAPPDPPAEGAARAVR